MNVWSPAAHRRALLLTSPLCWPISSRAEAGDLCSNDLDVLTSREDVSAFTAAACAPAALVLTPQCAVSFAHSPWARCRCRLSGCEGRAGFSGSRRLEGTDSRECRSAGSHTSPALPSSSSFHPFWGTCRLSAQRREPWSLLSLTVFSF